MAINIKGLCPKTEKLITRAFGRVSYPNGESGINDLAGEWLRRRGLVKQYKIHHYALAGDVRSVKYMPKKVYEELVALAEMRVTRPMLSKYVYGIISMDELAGRG